MSAEANLSHYKPVLPTMLYKSLDSVGTGPLDQQVTGSLGH